VLVACGPHHDGGTIDASGTGDGDPGTDAAECQAPDVMIVLDRTQSMFQTPNGTAPADTIAGHMTSKWYIATTAVEAVTAQLDTTVRFGLELFPRDPANGTCVTLSQRINGVKATNPSCEQGEVVVEPAPATGATIAATIDPETTLLCNTTPIGSALTTTDTELAAIRDPIRGQFVLFIGDGEATCGENPLAIQMTQQLARAGVNTFVVGFDGTGGIDPKLLNNMACAGHTAPGFPAPCTVDAAGDYTATDPSGAALFMVAGDAATLAAALAQVGGQVCCGCIL